MTATLPAEFNAFLFATVAQGANGLPLTLLSVLARRGVDPWDEAAELARLPKASATEKLASLLATIPNGPAAGDETVSLTARLMALLHRPTAPKANPIAAAPLLKITKLSKGTRLALYYLAGLIFLVLGQWVVSTRHAQTPMDTTIAPTLQK